MQYSSLIVDCFKYHGTILHKATVSKLNKSCVMLDDDIF